MSRYNYDSGRVDDAIADMDEANNILNNVNSEISSGISIIEGAQGSNYLKIDFSQLMGLRDKAQSAIKELSSEIKSKANQIEEYNNSSFITKYISTRIMNEAKLIEGIGTAGEQLVDGVATLSGAVIGIFNKDAKNSIGEFVKKDHIGDAFEKSYSDGLLSGVEKYSFYSNQSTAANIFKGVGVAAGYVGVALAGGAAVGAVGGAIAGTGAATGAAATAASAASSIGVNAAVAGIGGVGSGAERNLQAGKSYDESLKSGLKEGAVSAGTVVALGAVGKKVSGLLSKGASGSSETGIALSNGNSLMESAAQSSDDIFRTTSMLNAADDVPRLAVANTADDVANLTEEAVSNLGKTDFYVPKDGSPIINTSKNGTGFASSIVNDGTDDVVKTVVNAADDIGKTDFYVSSTEGAIPNPMKKSSTIFNNTVNESADDVAKAATESSSSSWTVSDDVLETEGFERIEIPKKSNSIFDKIKSKVSGEPISEPVAAYSDGETILTSYSDGIVTEDSVAAGATSFTDKIKNTASNIKSKVSSKFSSNNGVASSADDVLKSTIKNDGIVEELAADGSVKRVSTYSAPGESASFTTKVQAAAENIGAKVSNTVSPVTDAIGNAAKSAGNATSTILKSVGNTYATNPIAQGIVAADVLTSTGIQTAEGLKERAETNFNVDANISSVDTNSAVVFDHDATNNLVNKENNKEKDNKDSTTKESNETSKNTGNVNNNSNKTSTTACNNTATNTSNNSNSANNNINAENSNNSSDNVSTNANKNSSTDVVTSTNNDNISTNTNDLNSSVVDENKDVSSNASTSNPTTQTSNSSSNTNYNNNSVVNNNTTNNYNSSTNAGSNGRNVSNESVYSTPSTNSNTTSNSQVSSVSTSPTHISTNGISNSTAQNSNISSAHSTVSGASNSNISANNSINSTGTNISSSTSSSSSINSTSPSSVSTGINGGSSGTNVATSTIESVPSTSKSFNPLPGILGVGAVAAGAVGAKVYIDKKKNSNDSSKDNSDFKFSNGEWSEEDKPVLENNEIENDNTEMEEF